MKIQQGLLFIILLFSLPEASSQSKGIEYQYDKGALVSVLFANGKEFDINENNPFIIDLQCLPGSSKTYKVYDIQSLSINDIKIKLPNLRYKNEQFFDCKSYDILATNAIPTDYSNSVFAIAYQVCLRKNGATVACGAILNVFDESGNKIIDKKQLNSDCGSLTISQNGELLAYMYGLAHDESGRFMESGLVVYHPFSDQVLDEIKRNEVFGSIEGIGVYGDYINTMIRNYQNNDVVELIYYSAKTPVKYSKSILFKDYLRLFQVSEDSLSVGDPDKEDAQIITFDKDFQVEDLSK